MREERGKLKRESFADLVVEVVGRYSPRAKMAANIKSLVDGDAQR